MEGDPPTHPDLQQTRLDLGIFPFQGCTLQRLLKGKVCSYAASVSIVDSQSCCLLSVGSAHDLARANGISLEELRESGYEKLLPFYRTCKGVSMRSYRFTYARVRMEMTDNNNCKAVVWTYYAPHLLELCREIRDEKGTEIEAYKKRVEETAQLIKACSCIIATFATSS